MAYDGLLLYQMRERQETSFVIAKELESEWVFTYGHMRLGLLPQKLVVGIPARACESSALNHEVPVVGRP